MDRAASTTDRGVRSRRPEAQVLSVDGAPAELRARACARPAATRAPTPSHVDAQPVGVHEGLGHDVEVVAVAEVDGALELEHDGGRALRRDVEERGVAVAAVRRRDAAARSVRRRASRRRGRAGVYTATVVELVPRRLAEAVADDRVRQARRGRVVLEVTVTVECTVPA